jgi:S1-C subfamily serine protease
MVPVFRSDGNISADSCVVGVEALEQGILFVQTIIRGSPAEQCGLKVGDIITQVSIVSDAHYVRQVFADRPNMHR